MRQPAIIAAIACSLAAIPAAGRALPSIWTGEQLACPSRLASPDLARDMVEVGLHAGAKLSEANHRLIIGLAATCGKITGLGTGQLDAYRTYIIHRLMVDGFSRELAALGIPPGLVDQVMDIGPGRANLPFNGLNDAQADKLFAALAAKGIDTEKVPDRAFTLVGPYAVATSLMYRTMKTGG